MHGPLMTLVVITLIVVTCAFVSGIFVHVTDPDELPKACSSVHTVWKGSLDELNEDANTTTRSVLLLNETAPEENNIYIWCDESKEWMVDTSVLFGGQPLLEQHTQQGWVVTQLSPHLLAVPIVEHWFAPRPHKAVPNGFASVSLGEKTLELKSWNVLDGTPWHDILPTRQK